MPPKVPDIGHRDADKELYSLTRRLHLSYRQASISLREKIEKYLDEFEKEDAKKRALYDSGELSDEEFSKWREQKIIDTRAWRDMLDQLAEDMTNQNKIAASMINETLPEVYAINHNYGTYEAETGSGMDTTYTMYDKFTVKRLLQEGELQLPKPSPKVAKDKRWNRQHIQSAVLQGILTGEPMGDIAQRLLSVAKMTESAAIRNARTAVTGAENAGRIDSYIRAQNMGIKMKQVWMATLDSRTRDSHAMMDGEKVDPGKEFSNGCRYPGDPEGAPGEIYNCRCTLVAEVEGADPYNPNLRPSEYLKEEGLTYEQWKEMHGERFYSKLFNDYEEPDNGSQPQIVNGTDISQTWQRRSDKFDFEIEDVINAQGFDGLPRVVSQAEFDEAVKAANGGNGFIAQRAYSAPDQETLDLYRDQLYNGEWYVDCSTGGAQYGQGMYCAADYSGKLSDGIISEMKHYQNVGSDRIGNFSDEDLNRIIADKKERAAQVLLQYKSGEISRDEGLALYRQINSMEPNEYVATFMKDSDIKGARSYVETITLDPTAKIIDYHDLMEERNKFKEDFIRKDTLDIVSKQLKTIGLQDNEDAAIFMRFQLGYGDVGWDEAFSARAKLSNSQAEEIDQLLPVTREEVSKKRTENDEEYTRHFGNMDLGSFAAMRGYDVINAGGHGLSGSYTVILNRTKVIIKRGL